MHQSPSLAAQGPIDTTQAIRQSSSCLIAFKLKSQAGTVSLGHRPLKGAATACALLVSNSVRREEVLRVIERTMGSWRCFLLLCLLQLSLAFGEVMENDNDIDLGSFLKSIYSGQLLRDEPFLISRDEERNSRKELRHLEVPLVQEQTKDRTVSGDVKGAPGPVVITKDGSIKGVTVDKAHIFYGIPYADPPVGAYRWKPPRPVTPWQGVYDGSFPRAACMQACSGPIAAECPRTVSRPASPSLHVSVLAILTRK